MFLTGSSGRAFRTGAVSGNHMFAVALVFIICGALALTGYFTCRSPGSTNQDGPQGISFKCDKCDAQFVLDLDTMPMGERMELEQIRDSMQSNAIDCTQCGAKKKAFEMITCPNPECKKPYVPAMYRTPLKQQQNPKKYKDICPECKMGLTEARVKARNAPK